jgi:hypothetical protein
MARIDISELKKAVTPNQKELMAIYGDIQRIQVRNIELLRKLRAEEKALRNIASVLRAKLSSEICKETGITISYTDEQCSQVLNACRELEIT